MVKIEVVDAGLPSRPHMQSPLHNRRIQRIGIFAFVFLTVIVFALYNRTGWSGLDLHKPDDAHREAHHDVPLGESDSKKESYAPAEEITTTPVNIDPMLAKPNTPVSSPAPASGPVTPENNTPSYPDVDDLKKPNTHTPAVVPVGEAAGFDETRVAMIIETRPISHLPALLTQFISTLPPQWVVKHVGGSAAFEVIKAHAPLRRHITSGKLRLIDLPAQYPTQNNEDLSATLTNLTFYRDFLKPAEWLLMFQTDSMICSGAETSVDDWVDKGYDWVGAPWHPNRRGGNGGLSLRHVPAIVELLKTDTRKANDSAWEDLWLCERLKNAAPADIESSFSVEMVYHERPLGYHLRGSGKGLDPGIWSDRKRRRQIFNYCPEIKIVLGIMGLESGKEEQWRLEDEGLKKPNAKDAIEELIKGISENANVELKPFPDEQDKWTLSSNIPLKEEKGSKAESEETKTSGKGEQKVEKGSKSGSKSEAKESGIPKGVNVDQNSYGEHEKATKIKGEFEEGGVPAESKALEAALAEETAEGGRWTDE